MPDNLTAILEGWRKTEQDAPPGPWKPGYRTWTEISDEQCAEARIIGPDDGQLAITFLSDVLEPDRAAEVEAFIVTARIAMPRLVAALEAVLKLHRPVKNRLNAIVCRNDRYPWPCPEVTAITREITGKGE